MKVSKRTKENQNSEMLLWHPWVHKFYNENLYYFALRFAPYRRDTLRKLKNELLQNKISGVCLYEIFGEFDLLLRAWLTPAIFPRVIEILSKFPTLVARPVFRVTEIRHWAFSKDLDLNALQQVLVDPQNIEGIQKARRDELLEALIPYVEKGVAFHRPTPSERLVKFYTAISFREPSAITISAEKDIKETLFNTYFEYLGAKRGIRNLSIYVGEGFAHAFIKGVSNTPAQARDFIVDHIINQLRAYLPVTTTFIVSEQKPYECDYVSDQALDTWSRGSTNPWIETWFPELYTSGVSLTMVKAIESRLIDNQNILRSLSYEEGLPVFKYLLEGLVTGDNEKTLKAILPWFAKVEYDLRQNWFPFLRAISNLGGKDVEKVDLEIKAELNLLREERSGKEITLGDRLNMYLKAMEKYERETGFDYRTQKPAELTRVRNLFAHGNMLSELPRLWEEVFNLLIWFIPLYERILKRIQQVVLMS